MPSITLNNKKEYYTQISKPLIDDDFLHSKAEILTYLKTESQNKMNTNPELAATMEKIITRAENKLKQLEHGQEVKIPAYYHATKTVKSVVNILKSSIHANSAIEGKGVYVSSEMEPKYGSFIFALDRDDLENMELSESSKVNQSKIWAESASTHAVWRALKDDFPVNDHQKIKAAYLIVKNPEDRIVLERELEKHNLKNSIEIVSYEEATEEMKMIQEFIGVYEPKSWSSFWNQGIESLAHLIALSSQETSEDEYDSDWD